jgi:phosphatidylglycerol:prolipoprotein diacylglycerol transferase
MFDIILNAIPFPDWISPNVFTIGKFSLKWYGVSYIVGIYLALLWAIRCVRNREIWIPSGITRGNAIIPSKQNLDDLMLYTLFGIIVGGRLGSVLLYTPEMIINDPIAIFKIWEGGMAFHGGFAGVCVAVWLYARKTKIELWRVADMAAVGAPLGIFMVRLFGNFANQELYGRPTDVPWAFIFNSDPTSQPRHPSQLYEAALEGIALWFIIRIATHHFKALTKPGKAAGLFFLGYGVFRIFVEFFREPDAALFGPLTRGMSYSLPMVVIGFLIIAWAQRRPPVAPKRLTETTDE